MQIQPKSDEPRLERVQRARQALRNGDDAFKGGGNAPPLRLKSPWLMGTSRLFARRDAAAEKE